MTNFDLLITIFIATLQLFTGFIVPVILIVLFNEYGKEETSVPFIGCQIVIIISCVLTLFNIIRTAEYNRNEINRTAQVLINNGVTNTIDTNMQYHIDILLLKSKLEEKYGPIEEISIIK